MRRRNGELQVFSTSFLDLLSCGLGGILLMFLAVMVQSRSDAETAAQETKKLQSELAATSAAVTSARTELAKSKRAQSALVGFNGTMKNVVFIFDTSGSMEGPQFAEYQALLKNWLVNLPMERFNVIRYSSDVEVYRKGELLDATEINRRAGGQFVDSFQADGATNTHDALAAALEISGVDTVVLMSDGEPTPPNANAGPASGADIVTAMENILAMLKARAGNTVINTVAMGNYFEDAGNDHGLGAFLRQIAVEHHGTFIGR